MKQLKRVVIKEELVELVGDFRPAIILNQFIYWTERMYDTDKYILEEKERAIRNDETIDMLESKGWIYKTSEELNEELMVGMSPATIRKYIKQLVDAGYISQRRNPKYKWDKTLQYRVDLVKVQKDLGKIGYALEGYKLLPNIKIYDDVEDIIYTDDLSIESEDIEVVVKNKEASPMPVEEAESNNNVNTCTNIICDNEEKYTSELLENKNIVESLEDKNKRLMEQEKKFVPKYKL